jgi:hypothetical protein
MAKKPVLILYLATVYASAFGLTTILHEAAHAMAAVVLGIPTILYHSYTSYESSITPEISLACYPDGINAYCLEAPGIRYSAIIGFPDGIGILPGETIIHTLSLIP